MFDRISSRETFMRLAEVVAVRGTCIRLAVGAVVVDSLEQVVSTGYNGAPRGEKHCLEAGCELEALDDGKTQHCVRGVHAEVNALLQAGQKARGGALYVTHRPCRRCWNVILNSGVQTVYFRSDYGQGQSAGRVGNVYFEQLKSWTADVILPAQDRAYREAYKKSYEWAPTPIRTCYVAGPYTAWKTCATFEDIKRSSLVDIEGIRRNIEAARQVGRQIASHGVMPFIPHANTDETFLGIQDAQFWYDGTMRMLECADAVVLIDGWEMSKGATAEGARAHRIGKPVFDLANDGWERFAEWARGDG